MRWGAPFDDHALRAEVARFDPAFPIERALAPQASWYLDAPAADDAAAPGA